MMSKEREALAAAIAAHDSAIKTVAAARETLDRAQAFVRELEGRVAAFDSLDAKLAASRAASIKSALAAGAPPSFEPSTELADALTRKREAQNELYASRQGLKALQDELDAAVKAEARADLEKEWAAEKVLAAEADALATDLLSRLDELRSAHYRMHAAHIQMVRRDPEETRGPHDGSLRHVSIMQTTQDALSQNVIGASEFHRGHFEGERIAKEVAAYFARLKSDAHATYEDSK